MHDVSCVEFVCMLYARNLLYYLSGASISLLVEMRHGSWMLEISHRVT